MSANEMSLRDWFAGQVIRTTFDICMDNDSFIQNAQGLCGENWEKATRSEVAAIMAFAIADAMLKARGGDQ